MNPLLEIYLAKSERLKNGYRESLGAVNNHWRKILSDIYSTYSGTFNEISDQRLFDFLPGYRLIHITEIKKLAMDFWTNLNSDKTSNCLENAFIIPVFANYSSDYLCYVMEDGYLDYDMENEAVIGAAFNPKACCWNE